MTCAQPRVLHVLPVDLTRGAQTYAAGLRRTLDGRGAEHRTLTLFASSPAALKPDWTLGIHSSPLRHALDPRVLRALRRELLRWRPDVVFAHGGEPLKYLAVAAPKEAAVVYVKIGTLGARLTRRTRRTTQRLLISRADRVVAVSDDVAREARHLGVCPERLSVIPNGRDPALYRGHAESSSPGTVRLAFIGHLTRTKRPERFVRLVARLRGLGADVEGVVAGDGPLLASLRGLCDESGVRLLGRCDDIPGLLASCDAVVFTSAPEGEGMPGVLIEAGMASLPVLATDVPGVRSVVVDGVTGLVVPVEDPDALTAAALRLVSDRQLRLGMGREARQRCLAQFTLERSARLFADLIDTLVAERCGPGATAPK